ncbi:MAG: serine O-acetyltransferase EpsC [Pseudomonadota bacterium]|nr:serine O-acetyltransferase EpsC [Pseudomonadota bacterium]
MNTNFLGPLKEDLDSFLLRDPAARSRIEVFLCYSGYHALIFYRIANKLWQKRFFLVARFLSNFAKIFTGIEVHPGATIGRGFFIDHGAGVVIGETSEIGDGVTLYQGVTLGGTSLEKGKRHPTLGNNVIVGSGAQVLGPIKVGDGARIGANAVVLKDVPKDSTMVGIPAKVVMGGKKGSSDKFTAYGTPTDDLPDPVLNSFESLRSQLSLLSDRIEYLETKLDLTNSKEELVVERQTADNKSMKKSAL